MAFRSQIFEPSPTITTRGVAYPGFGGPHPGAHAEIEPGGVAHLTVAAGDLIRIDLSAARFTLYAALYGASGPASPGALGLASAATTIAPGRYDHARLTGWRAARGDLSADVAAAPLRADGEPLVLRAAEAGDLWLIAVADPEALVDGEAGGEAVVQHERASPAASALPPPLGAVREAFTVPRGAARAYPVAKGEIIQIIDVEGRQCSDFTAFHRRALDAGLERMIDSTVTRTLDGGAYPTPGLFDKFYDADMRPLLGLVQDTVGRHDTFALACTAYGYEERGFPGHVNCSDNISDALEPYGIGRRRAWPAINFFFNSWISPLDARLRVDEAWSRPGDYVALRALDDLICVSTACPDDIDPINGWNPTDVHVRIYSADAPITRAAAHRPKEDAVPTLTQESAFAPRTRALTRRFAPARDVWLPAAYDGSGALGEYWACREAATLQDMSALRKFDVRGPDAAALLQQVLTRDLSRLAVHRGAYALICDEDGAVVDDGTVFRLGPDLFRWCCGSEESGRALSDAARSAGLRVWVDALHCALPNLALQGPRSREILRQIVFTRESVPSLDALKWFGCTMARLGDEGGAPFFLTRSGFTGELGFEIFCGKADAVAIWDAIMAAGAPVGLKPMGGEALETIRIEAGLAMGGAEFGGDVDALEAGLGFAVDFRKPAFTGRAALERIAAAPRRVLVGLRFDGTEPPEHGDPVLAGERPVGVVTSATRSPSLGCAIALARVAAGRAETGARLDVGRLDGRMKRLSATVCAPAFVDPDRTRARA